MNTRDHLLTATPQFYPHLTVGDRHREIDSRKSGLERRIDVKLYHAAPRDDVGMAYRLATGKLDYLLDAALGLDAKYEPITYAQGLALMEPVKNRNENRPV